MSLTDIYRQQGIDSVCELLKIKKFKQYDIDDLLTSCSYNIADFIKINELGYCLSVNYEKNIGTMASRNMLTTFGMYDYIKKLYDQGFRYKDVSDAIRYCSECVPVDTRVLKLLLHHHYNGENDLVNPFEYFIHKRNITYIQILIDHGIECNETIARMTMCSNMNIFSLMHERFDMMQYKHVFLKHICFIFLLSDAELFIYLMNSFQPDQDVINNLYNFIGTTDRVIHDDKSIKCNFLIDSYPPDEHTLELDTFNRITKKKIQTTWLLSD